jgi:uncharacterized protein (TIGR02147 family)
MEPDVLDYHDYREYLKEFYNFRKLKDWYFSYRFMGNKVGMEASSIVRVFQGSLHLADDGITRWSDFLKLDLRRACYFETLVRFCKTNSDIERRACWDKLLRLKEMDIAQVEKDQEEYYLKWYHTPIRSLLGMPNEDHSPEAIASRLVPPISVQDAQQAIDLLLRLGMVRKSESGAFELSAPYIAPDISQLRMAIRTFQKDTMTLASDALQNLSPELRDISAVSVTLNPEDMPLLQEHIRHFRKSIMDFSTESKNPRSIYQLNIQFFPLTTLMSGVAPKEASA